MRVVVGLIVTVSGVPLRLPAVVQAGLVGSGLGVLAAAPGLGDASPAPAAA